MVGRKPEEIPGCGRFQTEGIWVVGIIGVYWLSADQTKVAGSHLAKCGAVYECCGKYICRTCGLRGGLEW